MLESNHRPLVAVVDGQGGGMGCALIEKIRAALDDRVRILALGTNALATQAMLKSGAHAGATGENAIVLNVSRADFVVGPIGIIIANAMIGELTPRMAEAISSSPAWKLLLPVTTCNVDVAGIRRNTSLPELIAELVEKLRQKLEAGAGSQQAN